MFSRGVVATQIKICARRAAGFSTSAKVSNSVAESQGAVRAGLVLQRDPIVIQQTKGFEAAADKYFGWLEYMTAERFPRDMFFKKGSAAESKWMEQEDQRSDEWYFDPATKPEFKSVKREAVVDETTGKKQESKGPVVNTVEVHPRETEADRAGDLRSLERKLDRTLYLVVKAGNQWVFPQGAVEAEEALHQAARRSLKDMCGGNMDVWTVGRGPVGHHEADDRTATFFIKGHILRGQVKPTGTLASDFKWVTREEVEATVSPAYWGAVKDMLSSI
ncbi:hypothetical protein EV175_003199 [Coemansia sp. RSA 1933]|nr:hypothetical protein EV175_003199 [Coemansia sp. RSA 1933]